ncbi:MAG: hypothetical protein JWM11_36, partial [Planctomycetaceae bacterium]|nr:hypothetical protein [Planctomycetaceae bacterium]
MPNSTQSGGASTNYGVLYQTLWCLMKAARIRVGKGVFPGTNTDALIILEPYGGGGDITLQTTITEVDQVKAKADQGTWSLQTVIRDVLPDLFLAIKDDSTTYRLRFVTEGTRGRWDDVYKFFRRIGDSPEPDTVLGALDDKVVLKFQTRHTTNSNETASIFVHESYTERTLFELIASQIKSRPMIARQNLPDGIFLKRVWKLLGAFEFEGNQRLLDVQREIDQLLLSVVDHRDDIPQVRQALAFSLMDKAASGNAEVTAKSLFTEHHLNAHSLLEWTSLRNRAKQDFVERIKRTGYESNLDVRKSDSVEIVSSWDPSRRVLIFAG